MKNTELLYRLDRADALLNYAENTENAQALDEVFEFIKDATQYEFGAFCYVIAQNSNTSAKTLEKMIDEHHCLLSETYKAILLCPEIETYKKLKIFENYNAKLENEEFMHFITDIYDFELDNRLINDDEDILNMLLKYAPDEKCVTKLIRHVNSADFIASDILSPYRYTNESEVYAILKNDCFNEDIAKALVENENHTANDAIFETIDDYATDEQKQLIYSFKTH